MRSSRSPLLALLVATLLVLALAACGGDDDGDEATDKTTTTTEAETSTTADEPAQATTTTTASNEEQDVWSVTAAANRGKDGERFTLECTPDGTEGPIWGAELYTDDSSVCTAAVHVGLITFEEGGEVEYEIAPGEDAYESGDANGVLSNSYGAWDGSFFFPEAPPGTGEFAVGVNSWDRNAVEYRGRIGDVIVVECSPGGSIGSVWGTDTYTDDSSICSAAVHAGLITVEDGGRVAIEIAAGEDSYEGSSANGVTSQDYPAFEGSFTFPDRQPTAR